MAGAVGRDPSQSVLVGYLDGESVFAEVFSGEARYFNRVGALRIGDRRPAFEIEWTAGELGGATLAQRVLDRLRGRTQPRFRRSVRRRESAREALLDPLLAHVDERGPVDFAFVTDDAESPHAVVIEADRLAHDADVAAYSFDRARGIWRVELQRFDSDAECHF